MWLGVLGPLECVSDDGRLEVGGRLNRALLECLAVDRRRVTGVDELVDALWPIGPPRAAEKAVRNRVSGLRSVVGPGCIETVCAGYRLGAAVGVDAAELEDTAGTVTSRLALWRGPPFQEILEWAPARAAAVRLVELHAHLEEVAIAEQLDGGVDASVLVGPAEHLVESEPFRERRWALLMRVLYLAGRQRDALEAFRRARDLLRDELGLSPGAELLTVERAILDHDPSLGAQRSRIPAALRRPSALIGRAADAREVRALLDVHRVVTLAGLGGVGKTTLAREVAAECAWPHCLVDLAAVDEPAGVADAVARSLQIAAGKNARRAIGSWARQSPPFLLVLDNCEHVRGTAADIAEAVRSSGDGPTVLATSRIPLGLEDETVFHLRPLARPDAVALYRARAGHRRVSVEDTGGADDEAAVDRLCELLGDIPLAIELVASRASILSPSDMVRDLAGVTASAPTARRSPRWRDAGARGIIDVVAWAVAALSGDAAMVFRRCAVFPGGFTMEAARLMVDDGGRTVADGFSELADASLIEVQFGATTRYRYLDLIRRRAAELLDDAGERARCEERLIRWAVAETDDLTYPDLRRVVAELTNLTAAADQACRHGDVDAALRITGASSLLIGAERADLLSAKLTAVQLPGAPQHPRYLRSCAELAFGLFILRGDARQARAYAELVLDVEPDSRSGAWATFTLGHVGGDLGHVRRALDLARRWQDPALQYFASCMIIDNGSRGGAADAWDLVVDGDRIAAAIDEPWARILATMLRGMAYCQLDPAAALIHLERCAEMAQQCGLRGYATVARGLAGLAGGSDDPRSRLELTRRGLVDASRSGATYMAVLALSRIARTLSEIGRPDRAATFAGAANARVRGSTWTGERLYLIDRENYPDHAGLFDLGATLSDDELIALVDAWLSEPSG